MDNLIAFLRARLDEDEAAVRCLKVPHEWHTGPGDDPEWTNEELVCMWPPEFHTPYEQDKHWRGLTIEGPELAAYIARHDPARVLAEIDAKRQILREYDDAKTAADADPRDASAGVALLAFGIAIRALAAPHANHPGYREGWRL